MQEKVLYIDCESTGRNPFLHGLHQIAGIVEIDGEVKESFDITSRIHPNCPIDPEALKVCGITTRQLHGYQNMDIAFKEFRFVLTRHMQMGIHTEKFFLCGYNVSGFDGPLLRKWFADNQYNYFKEFFHSVTIDVMVLACEKLRQKGIILPSYSLANVARAFGIQVVDTNLHDASYDIEITRALYLEIK